MLSITEYVEKRKTEDGMNEFDSSQKMNNIRSCIDYVFEYFDQYLPIQGAEKRTVAENERLTKFERTLRDYSPDIRDWLVSIYDNHDKQANKVIASFIRNIDDFPFMNEEAEFRALSYDCYAATIKKCPFFKNQAEMIYKFIREYHIRESNSYAAFIPDISPNITTWLKETMDKYNVNIAMGLENYLGEFWDNQDAWPARSRIKVENPMLDRKYRYNYRRKTNLFNIDGLYNRLAHKSFIKGHKKQMEILMMYVWLHSIDGDDENYWQEYLLQQEDY